MIHNLGRWLRSLNIFAVLGLALVAGVAGGLALWGGFNVVAAATSSNAFCTSCHEMAIPAEQYEHSLHYTNVYGIRAQCADCHVPKPFVPRVVDMVFSLRDVWGHMTGIIDTPRKFQAHKLAMAQYTWREMEANNSMGCRSCHSFEAMDFANQLPAAAAAMHPAMLAGMTCISCHRGVVHKLPELGASAEALFPDTSEASGLESLFHFASSPERP